MRSRIPDLSASVLPASTAAGEMDNFQLSISLSQKLSERRREGRTTARKEEDAGQMHTDSAEAQGESMLASSSSKNDDNNGNKSESRSDPSPDQRTPKLD